ncbi:MAG: signal peptidase I [Acidimicrobiia bacterium]|nr:signal peptidase I [Acidimicrobiia bacterium]
MSTSSSKPIVGPESSAAPGTSTSGRMPNGGVGVPEVPSDVASDLVRYRLEDQPDGFDFDPRPGPQVAVGVDTDEPDGEEEKKKLPLWQELPILLVVALIVAIVVKTFLFQSYFIPSESMRNTLEINDRVAVNKLSYVFGDIERSQIVVFDTGSNDASEPIFDAVVRLIAESIGLSSPDSVVIKRVIGLPGEAIEIIDNQLYVDGVPLNEPYLGPESRMANFGPVTVEEGTYFLMGDNRARSSDSRRIGAVSEEDIIGRAFVRMWPLSRWSGL